MPKPKNNNRDMIVRAAVDLFYEKGYERTSLADIAERAGINTGSLYYVFKTKESVLLAVLDWYLDNLNAEIVDPVFTQVEDPIERIFGILSGYRIMLEMTECNGGCPIGNLALEVGGKMPEAATKIAENFEQWKQVIRDCVKAAGDRLPADLDVDQTADLVLTIMEGGIMQSRAYKSIEPYDSSIAGLRAYFDSMTGRRPV